MPGASDKRQLLVLPELKPKPSVKIDAQMISIFQNTDATKTNQES